MKKSNKKSNKIYMVRIGKRENTIIYYDENNKKHKIQTVNKEEPCFKHKCYKGKCRPKVACEQCWRIYFAGERLYWESF